MAPRAWESIWVPPKPIITQGLPPKSRNIHGLPPKSRNIHGLPPKSRNIHGLPPKSRKTHGLSLRPEWYMGWEGKNTSNKDQDNRWVGTKVLEYHLGCYLRPE